MNLMRELWLGLLVAAVGAAVAQSAEPAKLLRLEFRAIPIEGVTSPEHKVTPYRIYDKIVVTVSDPVLCGQKPIEPTVSVKDNKLLLSYKLTPSTAGAQACTLVSEFDVFDAPKRDLEVNFAGGPEPYTVATMRKCPYFKPATSDIWECLVPAAK